MFSLHGIAASHGVAIGRAVLLDSQAIDVSHFLIDQADVSQECSRFETAINTVKTELDTLFSQLPSDAPTEVGAFIDLHSLILQDPMLSRTPLELIRQRRYNAEWALVTQMDVLTSQFDEIEDQYLRERKQDVRQVVERILKALTGKGGALPSGLAKDTDEPLILVAHDIAPADMMQFKDAGFAGFATDLGGATSHTAIVARSLDIPAAVGLGSARALLREGDLIILDGSSGVMLIDPSAQVLDQYRERVAAQLVEKERLSTLRDLPAQTQDGHTVKLFANIELPEDVPGALAVGAQGVGLFRSEFLFMGRKDWPTEDEQFEAYATVVREMGGLPVTIRTLDIGADKEVEAAEQVVATNPALGLRAIRYCLAHPDMFKTQLRALLRASALGPVKILIPMLASERELDATLRAIDLAKHSLREDGLPYDDNVPVGAMIEIPAAAIMADMFASRLQFLSLGTNDLIQYTLAIDRGDVEVSHLYDPQHPAVLALIEQTIQAGKRAGIPVSLCGEMAGDSAQTQLLLRLGLEEFSMHPAQIPSVKDVVRKSKLSAAKTLH